MNRKLILAVSAAAALTAGTVAVTAANRPNHGHYFGHRYGGYYSYDAAPGYYAYGAGPGYWGYAPRRWGGYGDSYRCGGWYRLYQSEPPGGIIQDRDYQESVLGQQFC